MRKKRREVYDQTITSIGHDIYLKERGKTMKTMIRVVFTLLLFGLCLSVGAGYAEAKKPNILVIWGDDVGITNISAYSHGIMGYKTPNIDRIAKEGAQDKNN